jgi:hypothetical protein
MPIEVRDRPGCGATHPGRELLAIGLSNSLRVYDRPGEVIEAHASSASACYGLQLYSIQLYG